ncbi:MAG: TonB family protein [Elusimicrobia bacterium]|nr:TonB family protein [Elusimicrobiota bacterium]
MIGTEEGEARLFRACIAVSFVFHVLFFSALGKGKPMSVLLPDPIEIDLTKPFGGPANLAAPKRLVPWARPGPNIPTESVVPAPVEEKPALPKDWTLPGSETRKVEPLAQPAPTPGGTPEGAGTAATPGGAGVGSDTGVPGGTGDGSGSSDILSFPKLLNRDEIFGMLQRYYPEAERRAGREGTVRLALHIGADGRVTSAEVLESAGAAFDRAAAEVAKFMRFQPAMTRKGPVAVKLPQPVLFQLDD